MPPPLLEGEAGRGVAIDIVGFGAAIDIVGLDIGVDMAGGRMGTLFGEMPDRLMVEILLNSSAKASKRVTGNSPSAAAFAPASLAAYA